MSEPTHERVVAILLAQLATIQGGGGNPYWYQPDHVFRHPTFDGSCYGSSDHGETIYVLVPDRTERVKNTNKTFNARMLADLVVLRRLPVSYNDQNPLKPPAEKRELIQARLSADVERKLLSDPTYAPWATQGLQVYDIQVTTDERDADLTDIEGWSCAYLRLQVQFFYHRDTP